MVTIYPTAFGARSGRHAPWHMKNGSNRHRVQPSRITTLLSSHSSLPSSTPLPHTKSTAVHKHVCTYRYTPTRKDSTATQTKIIMCIWMFRTDALILNYYASADLRVNKCTPSTYIPRVFEKRKWPTLCFGYTIFGQGSESSARRKCKVTYPHRGKTSRLKILPQMTSNWM